MENESLFYILGLALVVSAVVLAAIGLRAHSFPSPGVFRALLVPFAALVIATGVFAVRSASDEKAEREEHEAAEASEEAVAEEEGAQAEADQPGGDTPPAEIPAGAGETLKVSSPADGALSFDQKTLDAKPGPLTITYDNSSPVPHNVALESPEGEEIAQSETGANGTFELTAEVEAGDYVFFCSVPGHREGGMEGTLAVK